MTHAKLAAHGWFTSPLARPISDEQSSIDDEHLAWHVHQRNELVCRRSDVLA